MREKIILLSISLGFLVETSVAMSYCPSQSIPYEEITRVSQDMKLDDVYKAIDAGRQAVDTFSNESDVLDSLAEPLNKTEAFCNEVDKRDRTQTERPDVLLQLQLAKILVMKSFFDFYSKVKVKLGRNADNLINGSTFAPRIRGIFGII